MEILDRAGFEKLLLSSYSPRTHEGGGWAGEELCVHSKDAGAATPQGASSQGAGSERAAVCCVWFPALLSRAPAEGLMAGVLPLLSGSVEIL